MVFLLSLCPAEVFFVATGRVVWFLVAVFCPADNMYSICVDASVQAGNSVLWRALHFWVAGGVCFSLWAFVFVARLCLLVCYDRLY